MKFCITAFVGLAFISPASAKTLAELTASGTPEAQGQAIVEELARRNHGYGDFIGDVEMDLEDATGGKSHRAFSVKILEHANGSTDGDRSLIVFSSPADIKGTAVLSHPHSSAEDEQWLFLPASRRTKRVSANNRSGAFVGSEFTFEDLTAGDPRKFSWAVRGKDACGSVECVTLEAVPKDPASAYSKRVLRVDGDLRVQSVAFFDKKGAKLKTLTYSDYQKLDGNFWRASAWTMKNTQSGKGTTLRFTRMKLKNALSGSDFTPEKLGN
jgi:hypothetical protein